MKQGATDSQSLTVPLIQKEYVGEALDHVALQEILYFFY